MNKEEKENNPKKRILKTEPKPLKPGQQVLNEDIK